MVFLSFLFIFSGLAAITAGVLMSTLYLAGAGKWPGLHPGRWERRFKKLMLVNSGGFLLTLVGILAGYGI